jgi:uncharacterized oxidoreductase
MSGEKGLVVITGASRGIGRALVQRYTAEGHQVLAIARGFDGAPDDLRVSRQTADLATREGIARVAERVAALKVPVQVLINNAGVQNSLDLTEATAQFADAIAAEIAVNLTAPILLAQALIPFMQRPGGTIVNVTSLVSLHPKPSAPVYSATKAGLASFTRALRHQVAPLGLRVVEAVPPLVATDMTAGRGSGKLSPEAIADAIYHGAGRGAGIVAPGVSRRALILNRVMPALLARIIARV